MLICHLFESLLEQKAQNLLNVQLYDTGAGARSDFHWKGLVTFGFYTK